MLIANGRLKAVPISDNTVLLSDEDGNIHSLNESAGLIYKLCVNGMDDDGIYEYIRDHCQVRVDGDLRQIVTDCIRQLVDKGILVDQGGD